MSRRKLLALLGTATLALPNGSHLFPASGQPNDKRTDSPSSEPNSPSSGGSGATVPGGESIETFGAVAGVDSARIARRNARAIRRATVEAGDGGTVYVPEGEYFYALADESFQFRFGHEEPRGVSFVGDGPLSSRLTLSATVRSDENYRAMQYYGKDAEGNSINHEDVTIRDICFDGNYREIDLDSGRTIWGFNVLGDGNFTLENVWIRGWWANATRWFGPSAEIKHCRFQENAIGVAQANETISAGHHVSVAPPAGESILLEDCEFLRCSGNVINHRFNDGGVTLRRGWIRGVGIGCIKASHTNATIKVEDTYVKGQTNWLKHNIPKFDMNGRWFFHRVSGEEYTPTLVLEDVLARDFSSGFLRCYGNTNLALRGDMIAVHNATTDEDRDVVIGGNGLRFDVGHLSIADPADDVTLFSAPNSTGRIGKLYKNEGASLGDTGDVSINNDSSEDWIDPDVVDRHEVGISRSNLLDYQRSTEG